MSDRERQILMSLVCGIQKELNLQEQRIEWWLPGPGGWGIGKILLKGTSMELVDISPRNLMCSDYN